MDELTVSLRMLERIITVLISGLCIYLGYRLFFHFPYKKDDSTGELELPGMKLTMAKVGPGIFFAAFGAMVLVYSMTEKIAVNITTPERVAAKNSKATPPSDSATTNGLKAETQYSFLGFSPTNDTNQASLSDVIFQLNCAYAINERNSDVDTKANIRYAINHARYTLIQHHWHTQWGDKSQLTINGPSVSAHSELRALYKIPDNCDV